MIDLHSHILYGLDDGPVKMEESLEMAIAYKKAGFSKVVATPHWVPGTAWTPSPDGITAKIAALNASLESNAIGIRIYNGMEIAMDDQVAGLLAKNRLLTIADGPYVLIESPFQQMPRGYEQIFMALMVKGYKIILAHPERCGQMAHNPEMFDSIVDAGVYLQVNYDSFIGRYGSQAEESAVYLLQKGYVHCLATDSHDMVHRHPGSVHEALKLIQKWLGVGMAEVLCRTNPERVLSGLPLEMLPAMAGEKKNRKKWGFF